MNADELFSCCHHCDLDDNWHCGRHTDDHEGPCPLGCNGVEATS